MSNDETFLEAFIERGIGTIPSEIRRNLAHMQSLDKGYIHILQELRDREDDYLSRAHDAIFKLPVEFAKNEDENKDKDNHEDVYSYAHENENENEHNHKDHNANKSAAPPTKRRKVESGDGKDTDTDIDTTSHSAKKDVHVDVDMKMDKHRKKSGGKEGDKDSCCDSDCDSGDDDDDDDNINDSACEAKHEQGNKFWCNIKAGIPIPIPKIISSLESKDKEGDDNNDSNKNNNDESENGQPIKASESNQQQPMPTPTPTPTPTSTELIIPTKEELRQQFHDPAALLQIAILRRDARQMSEEKLSNANLTYQIVNDAIQTLTKDINQFEEILKATGQYVYEATPTPGGSKGGGGSGVSGSASGSASGGGASGSSSGARSASRSGSTGAGAGSSRNAGKLAAIQVPNSQDWILAKVIDHDAGTGVYNLSDEDFESNKSKSNVFVICYLFFDMLFVSVLDFMIMRVFISP